MDTVEKVLFEKAYLPAFIRKCASYGIEFPDEASLSEALDTTKMLLESADAQRSGVVKEAADALRSQLNPKPEVAQEPQEDEIVKAASQDEAFQLAALNAALGNGK